MFEPLKGYEGLYSINRDGVIRIEKKKKGRTYDNDVEQGIYKLRVKKSGHLGIKLMKNGIATHAQVHRLVALQFIPNPENKPQVNHIDGNPANNHVDNLEWCTASENTRHAVRIGLMVGISGKERWQSKPVMQYDLNSSLVNEWESISLAAKFYGFVKGNIIRCCKGVYNQAYGFKWSYA